MIDCDCTDESTEDVTAALKHSITRVFQDDVRVIIHGQCTDSGDGGTKYALQRALIQNNMAHLFYLVSTCSLHNLLSKPVKCFYFTSQIFAILETLLNKNFSPWAEDLSFLSVFCDQPVAKVVVRKLLGRSFNQIQQQSP
mmetsp:Transcript_14040/g.20502  ORF Transcript_14040/g.20502 Transcript_14040/m.20502 type:complete len:140 (-) Transcript_14040:363-782(-)